MKKIILSTALAAIALTACQTPEAAAPVAQEWNDAKLPQWAEHANIYEVNVRQYTEEGTLKAFQSHLPRLKEMGVDVLWFMPIQPIGELNRKGDLGSYYSISDYTAVNPNFGTIEDFQAIVKEAHELGMYVMLDWVANHTSFDHVWVEEHPEFYTQDADGNYPVVAIDNDGVPTDWTDVADLNYNAEGMREAMIAEMNWWVTTADIDGFRCDVAGFVPYDFWKTAIDAIRANDKPMLMLAEWEDPALIEAGFNAVYGWEFHHILNEVAQGHKDVSAIAEYDAKCDTVWPAGTMKMYFNTNHDENSWNGTVEERMGEYGQAMYIVASLMERSFPLIYSGQEAGLNHRYPFFYKDTVGVNWEGEHPETDFFATMLALKHQQQALANAQYGYADVIEVDTASNSMMIVRGEEGEASKVVGIFNFGEGDAAFEAPADLEEVISVKGASVYAAKLD
ncbi:MAG: hypothetical protein RL754_922 [Bacteroidota bacterium]|jgi:glycosidase